VVVAFSGSNLSVVIGLIVVLGLISAGLSTLEGLIQAVSSSFTSDIVKPVFGNRLSEKTLMAINKLAIVALAIATYFISRQQLLFPRLSVGILAQNGVYAYFSSAFVPVLFGIFLRKIDYRAPLIATLTAVIVHFGVYYGLPVLVEFYDISFGFFTKYLQGVVRNPAIAASTAIVLSTLAGWLVYLVTKRNLNNE
jgi:sodium/pantothenate symporter